MSFYLFYIYFLKMQLVRWQKKPKTFSLVIYSFSRCWGNSQHCIEICRTTGELLCPSCEAAFVFLAPSFIAGTLSHLQPSLRFNCFWLSSTSGRDLAAVQDSYMRRYLGTKKLCVVDSDVFYSFAINGQIKNPKEVAKMRSFHFDVHNSQR